MTASEQNRQPVRVSTTVIAVSIDDLTQKIKATLNGSAHGAAVHAYERSDGTSWEALVTYEPLQDWRARHVCSACGSACVSAGGS